MSKKHFQKLAYELMQRRPNPAADWTGADYATAHYTWQSCCRAVADACAQSNTAFDRDRFLAACEAEHYTPSMHGR